MRSLANLIFPDPLPVSQTLIGFLGKAGINHLLFLPFRTFRENGNRLKIKNKCHIFG